MTTTMPLEGVPIEEREARLADGAQSLAHRRSALGFLGNERFLLVVASTLMTIGLTAILLGWYGAARATLVEEQLPYLISGGLFGLALAVIGALTLFTHWLTVLVREHRAAEVARRQDHDALLLALRALVDAGRPEEVKDGAAGGTAPQRPLRRATRGS